MSASAQQNDIRLTLTIAIDGDQADIDIDPSKSIHDLIRHALVAHDIDEDPDACHLAGPDRLYFPPNTIGDAGLESGVLLSLRLPF